MILAERLCLFGFDPLSGRTRETPSKTALNGAVAALLLTDLLHAGRYATSAGGWRECDHLPMAHPLLDEAASRLSTATPEDPVAAWQRLQHMAPAAWRRLHRALAERDVLELQVPFPFVRHYRLRSRMAWNDAVGMLRTQDAGERLRRVALVLAAQRCGWLADLVDADTARAALIEAHEASLGDDAVAEVARLLATQR